MRFDSAPSKYKIKKLRRTLILERWEYTFPAGTFSTPLTPPINNKNHVEHLERITSGSFALPAGQKQL